MSGIAVISCAVCDRCNNIRPPRGVKLQHAHVGAIPAPRVPEQHFNLCGGGQVVETGVPQRPYIVHGDLKDKREHRLQCPGVHAVFHEDLPRPRSHYLQAAVGVAHSDGRVQPPQGEELRVAELPLGPVHLD